jgi:hypothetical protein
MARTPLRPDITAARTSARFTLGSGRELARLQEMLAADEAVEAMVQARSQGCFGLAVLTDTRLIFLCDGVIWKVSDDIALERIGLVQWQTVFGFGTLTVHAAGAPLQFTGMTGPGGKAVLRGLSTHLAEKDRLERQAREGILALTAHFAPEPAPDDISGFGDAERTPGPDAPAPEPELAAHI